MKRRSRWIALCLVLQAHAAWAQQTGGRFGGSNWGGAQPGAPSAPAPSFAPPPPPPMPPPAPSAPMPGVPIGMPPPIGVPAPSSPTPTPAAPSVPAPPPPPEAPPMHATNYRRPSPVDLAPTERPGTHPVDDAEYRVAHPSRDYNRPFGPTRTLAGLATGGVVFGLGAALTLWLTRSGASSSRPVHRAPATYRPPVAAGHPGVEVRRVSVAFDWSARAYIQQTLDGVAATVDTNTPQGLHAAAGAARDALAGAHKGARYGSFQGWALDPARGQQVFGQLADALRGRYTVESVNNARRVAAPKMTARVEEGAGLVVVTALVAVKGPLPPLPPVMSLPSLMAALDGLVPPRADLLAALEVVWSPAAPDDRMSSAELEVLYPELLRLDAAEALGRRVCGSCHAVYAGELGRCPACGAV